MLRSRTNKNKTPVVRAGCANCKEKSTLSSDFVSFESEEEVTLTFHGVLEKLFKVTIDPFSTNIIQLCRNCGHQLYYLYKCYKEFLDLCAVDSTLSQYIKNKANNSSDILPEHERPFKLKIITRVDHSKDVSKNCGKEEQKSELKNDAKDVYQNNTRKIGGDQNIKMDVSPPMDIFGPSDDNDGNIDVDDIDIKPLPFLLNEDDVEETEAYSPSVSKIGKIAVLCQLGGLESQTRIPIPTTTTESDELTDLKKRLEPVVGPSGHLKHPRTCPVCNKEFTQPRYMRIHLTKAHFIECGVPENKLVVPRTYIPHDCGICGKKLVSKQSLRSHTRYVHERQRNHACAICKKRFPTRSNLQVHSRTHTHPGQKTYLCSVCGRVFSTKGYLKIHFNQHFSDSASVPSKNYKCKLCGKSFGQSSKLEDHILEHENRRTYICDICGNSFNTSKSLSHHRVAHIDRFPCPHCERTFTRKGGLKDHLISGAHSLGLDEAKAAAGIFSKKIEITDAN